MGIRVGAQECLAKPLAKLFQMILEPALNSYSEGCYCSCSLLVASVPFRPETLSKGPSQVDRSGPNHRGFGRPLEFGSKGDNFKLSEKSNKSRKIGFIGRVKCRDVVATASSRDDQWGVVASEQDEQDERPAHPAVAVFERVDCDEAVVEPSGADDGMIRRRLGIEFH